MGGGPFPPLFVRLSSSFSSSRSSLNMGGSRLTSLPFEPSPHRREGLRIWSSITKRVKSTSVLSIGSTSSPATWPSSEAMWPALWWTMRNVTHHLGFSLALTSCHRLTMSTSCCYWIQGRTGSLHVEAPRRVYASSSDWMTSSNWVSHITARSTTFPVCPRLALCQEWLLVEPKVKTVVNCL